MTDYVDGSYTIKCSAFETEDTIIRDTSYTNITDVYALYKKI